MKVCTLKVLDEVNVSFEGLDPKVRRECNDALKYFLPHARHTPAYKLGRWDGTISLFALNGNTYYNLLDRVLPIILSHGYEVDIEDHREVHSFDFYDIDENFIANYAPQGTWPKGHQLAGQPIVLRDYQVEALKIFSENPQCMQEISTGAGKTLLTASMSILCEPFGRTVVIVPSKSLVDQTERDYRALGLDVGVYYGDRKEPGHKHTICTWQSLEALKKSSAKGSKTNPVDFQDLIDGVICVMVDEAHSGKADKLRELMTGAFANVPIRWGLTGTIPPDEHARDILLSTIGPVVNHLRARTLMDQGVLAQCHVTFKQMMDTGEFSAYHDEYKFLVTDRTKLDWMAKFIREVSQEGNTLVLFSLIETGEELLARLPNAEFVSGNTSNEERKKKYAEIAEKDNQVILATNGVAAVGIDLPRIFNLILIEPGKSFIRVIQSIGRGIRKAKDKDFVQIYDITSTLKYSRSHMAKRKKFYKDADYPYSVEKVDYIGEMSRSNQ